MTRILPRALAAAGALLIGSTAIVVAAIPAPATGACPGVGIQAASDPNYCYVMWDATTVAITHFAGIGGDIVIPATLDGFSVSVLDDQSFQGSDLTSVVIPDSVTRIAVDAFSLNLLTTVTIPDSVEVIGDYAFSHNNLTSLDLGDGVTFIGPWAFNENHLTSVLIPESVDRISNNAFEANDLTTLDLGHHVTVIEEAAFLGNFLTTVTIPDSVSEIRQAAFTQNLITSLTLGNSVGIIGPSAFQSNPLGEVTLPASLRTIGSNAFYDTSLTTVTIPAGVDAIGTEAFDANPLTTVTMLGDEPATMGDGVFGAPPMEGVAAYREAPRIPDLVMAGQAPRDVAVPQGRALLPTFGSTGRAPSCTYGPTVSFHASAEYTEGAVGCWLAGSTQYRVGDVVTVTFSSNWGTPASPVDLAALDTLEGYVYPELPTPSALTESGWLFDGWFDAASGGTALTFPLTITDDKTLYAQWTVNPCSYGTPSGDYCYDDAGGGAVRIVGYIGTDTILTIPTTLDGRPVTTIGSYAFNNCSLTSLTLPDSVTTIGEGAFSNCSLNSVNLGNGVTTIGDIAFAHNFLTSVDLPASVTTLGTIAFDFNPLAIVRMAGNAPATLGLDVFGDPEHGTDPIVTFHSGATYSSGAPFAPGTWMASSTFYRVQEESTVTFHSGYSGVPEPVVVVTLNELAGISDGEVADPGDPSAAGWHFDGWYDAPAIGNLVTFPLTVTADTHLYAEWTALPCGVDARSGDYCYVESGGEATITDYLGAGGDLVIPDTLDGFPVTAIGYCAFLTNGLTSVTIPDSVTWIDMVAFQDNDLTTVVVPDAVTHIGDSAFLGNDISTLVLGDSVATIEGWAFDHNNLTQVTIPASVTTIGDWAFGDNPLVAVTMEADEPADLGVDILGDIHTGADPLVTFHAGADYSSGFLGRWSAGGGHYRVQEVATVTFVSPRGTVPSPVTVVTLNGLLGINPGQLADPGAMTAPGFDFNGWNESAGDGVAVTFPFDVTGDMSLFADWVPDPCDPAIRAGDFCYTESGGYATIVEYLGSGGHVTVPEDVDGFPVIIIDRDVFAHAGITSLDLPGTIVTIRQGAFAHNSLTSLVIPDSVVTIEMDAFIDNPLTSLTLGDHVSMIGDNAFRSTTLLDVWMEGDAPALIGVTVFGDADPFVTFLAGAEYTPGDPGDWDTPGAQYRVREVVLIHYESRFGTQYGTSAIASVDAHDDVTIAEVDYPGSPARGGYIFTGWYDSLIGGEPVEFPFETAADVTLYAHFVAPTVTAPDTSGAGRSIEVEGTDFEPGESVTIELHSDPVLLTTVVADGAGELHATVTLPSSSPTGSHTLVLTGSASGVTSRPIVLAGDLAVTGTNPAVPALMALALVGAGLLLRRRAG